MPSLERNIQQFRFEGVEFEIEFDASERTISENIRNTGVWEDHQLILYKRLITPSGLFVDVGANVGVNSIFAKKIRPEARVLAVEASIENVRLLNANASRAGDVHLEVKNVAVSDKNGSVGFLGSGTNAHLSPSNETSSTMIPCVTLDYLLSELDSKTVDLLKIDVEGYTDRVLAESKLFLANTDNAIIEFSHEDVINRFGLNAADHHPDVRVVSHCTEHAKQVRRFLPHMYYISRSGPLVEILNSNDIFYVIFQEACVGDLLFTKSPLPDCISASAFSSMKIHDLMRQNHSRIMELHAQDARLKQLNPTSGSLKT
jgi:FkbM family methyltransferase